MKYFKDINTLEELRKQYKELLKKFHPDNPNGSTEATQEINAEYDKLFQILKDKHDSKTAGNQDNKSSYEDMKWDFAEDEKLRDVLNKIITFTGINIEIIGNWIWIDGDTYGYKDEVKAMGFKWAREKKKWYYHTETFRKRSHKKLSIDDIRNYYGSTEVKPEERKRLRQA
ncbi:J domain-containing protein [Lacrimispora indolis]|uniref:J domain-containing protein n=1 Tax=Lacrimispora indolis TaxID=69825 RepID=UPI000427EA85|nr:J domain-containing protein [[Clostridium] methoxybenzovorans]